MLNVNMFLFRFGCIDVLCMCVFLVCFCVLLLVVDDLDLEDFLDYGFVVNIFDVVDYLLFLVLIKYLVIVVENDINKIVFMEIVVRENRKNES